MSLPPLPDNAQHTSRPVLPPIRHLFRDELSQSSPASHNSPPLTLARLHVTEHSSDAYPSSQPPLTRHIHQPPATLTHRTWASDNYYQDPPHFSSHARESDDRHFTPDYTTRRSHDEQPIFRHTDPRRSILQRSASYSEEFYNQPEWSTVYTRNMSHPDHLHNQSISRQLPHPTNAPGGTSLTGPPSFSWDFSGGGHGMHLKQELGEYRSQYADTRNETFNAGNPEDAVASTSKYECSYCGKGFTRPSSLKIHLNSHTGEKPFVCPVENCGRSFSVLSNMRRHARVHTPNLVKGKEPQSDEESRQRNVTPDLQQPITSTSGFTSHSIASSHWYHRRRDSSPSISSTSSTQRSRSVSLTRDQYDQEHPEKRTRRYPK